MKCVVFGGGGFIGAAVVEKLLTAGYSIRVFDKDNVAPFRQYKPSENVEWITGDFTNNIHVNNAVIGMDIVVHLISTTVPSSSNDNPIYDLTSNVVSTINLLNAIVAHDVKKIIFISSGGTVYGEPKYLPIDEHHPTNPLVSYGIGKLTIEKYIKMFSHIYGVKAIALRVSNPYGDGQNLNSSQGAVNIFLQRALQGLSIEIWGDGSVVRDYIFIHDVADAFLKAIEYEGLVDCFNISSGVGTSLQQLIDLLSESLGQSINVIYKNSRSFDAPVSILNNSLAENELKWTPTISMTTGIELTSQWLKSQLP